MKKFIIAMIGVIIIGVGVYFGGQYFTKTGMFKIPGVVYYDESLNAEELELLRSIFTDDVQLEKDVRISARDSLEASVAKSGEYVTKVLVPVTDYYDTRTDTNEFEEFEKIPIEELDATKKLLSINGEYYLDTFNKGAYYRMVKFESEDYDNEIMPLIYNSFVKEYPTKDTVLTFAQTGVTALSRGMNAKMYQVGNGAYFAEKIGDFLSSFDLTHTSNESSFTDFASSSNICSDKRFIDTLTAIGLDIVELGGNHNIDCGDQSAIDSLAMYTERGIKTVGGGATAEEAAKPLLINKKGSGITFLAYNQSTGGATHDATPGANQYYEENAISEIKAAKERGDFVIVDIQYYECNSYASEYEDPVCDYPQNVPGDEIGFFRHLIDLGADLVVGVSAHQPQTFELYGDGAIYYGLGNLFFDQVWWPGTTRSLVLGHYFYKGKLLQTKITPTVYDNALQVRVMDEETAKWFLNRLISERP